MKDPMPPDEEERLKALHLYEILDTDPKKRLDDNTFLAARICGTPIAIISLIDENHQWRMVLPLIQQLVFHKEPHAKETSSSSR